MVRSDLEVHQLSQYHLPTLSSLTQMDIINKLFLKHDSFASENSFSYLQAINVHNPKPYTAVLNLKISTN